MNHWAPSKLLLEKRQPIGALKSSLYPNKGTGAFKIHRAPLPDTDMTNMNIPLTSVHKLSFFFFLDLDSNYFQLRLNMIYIHTQHTCTNSDMAKYDDVAAKNPMRCTRVCAGLR